MIFTGSEVVFKEDVPNNLTKWKLSRYYCLWFCQKTITIDLGLGQILVSTRSLRQTLSHPNYQSKHPIHQAYWQNIQPAQKPCPQALLLFLLKIHQLLHPPVLVKHWHGGQCADWVGTTNWSQGVSNTCTLTGWDTHISIKCEAVVFLEVDGSLQGWSSATIEINNSPTCRTQIGDKFFKQFD